VKKNTKASEKGEMEMTKVLRILALLTAASMLLWIAGCGDDDDDDDEKGPPPEVASISVAEGDSIAGNASIVITFSKSMESADVAVTDATGTVAIAGKVATWTPSADMSAGEHTLTGTGTDKEEQTVDFGPVKFTATAADNEDPTILDDDCVPENGDTGVEPTAVTETVTIKFSEDMGSVTIESLVPEESKSEELVGDTLTITFLGGISLGNETTVTIGLSGKDLAGNNLGGSDGAIVEYTFTTMKKEED
jgi:hypothetical protein